jgi:MFS family permease
MWKEHNRLAQDSRRVADAQAAYDHSSFGRIFHPPYVRYTFALLFANFFGMFAWWGLFTWMPPYLSLPVSQGGRGFGVVGTTTLLVALNLFGMFPGYFLFGWVADRLGRKRSFILYTLSAAILVPLYAAARQPWLIMILGGVRLLWHGIFSDPASLAARSFRRGFAPALGFATTALAPWVSTLLTSLARRTGGGRAGAVLCAAGFSPAYGDSVARDPGKTLE